MLNIKDFYVKIDDLQILKTLDIYETMLSGQHFRHKETEEGILFVYGNGVYCINQGPGFIELTGTKDFDWKTFFGWDVDYGMVQKVLSKKDDYLKAAISSGKGVRILRQDPFEMLLTFIISQSKQIPQIQILVERISENYGHLIGNYKGIDYYGFPRPEALRTVKEEDFRALKLGYRAPYIVDAIEKILAKEVDLEKIKNMSYAKGRIELMKIKGVGTKVADCVLLFAYGKYDAFPVDTWIKKILSICYFEEMPSNKVLETFAQTYFGAYRGIAQQYLFEYARKNPELFKEN